MLSRTFFHLFVAVGLAGSVPNASILQVDNVVDIIPENWIVVMKNTLSDAAFQIYLDGRDPRIKSGTKSTFNIGTFKGYSGVFGKPLIDLLLTNIDVSNSRHRNFPL